MNAKLKDYMSVEKTADLFFYFKHDGAYDFEKKVVAGQVLMERGFYRHKLRGEKEKIVAELEKEIHENSNPEKITEKSRQELKKSIIWAVTPWLFYLLLKTVDWFVSRSWDSSDRNTLLAFAIAFVLIVLFRIYTYRKELNKFVKQRIDDCELHKRRLKVINEEWPF